MNIPNLRTQTLSSTKNQDVRDTSQLKGEAKKTKAEGETNETSQYYSKDPKKDPRGGEAKPN